jgi:hypothetical protein
LWFVEHLKIWDEPAIPYDHFGVPVKDKTIGTYYGAPWLGGVQRSALAWVVGAVAGVVLLEAHAVARTRPLRVPVEPARAVALAPLPQGSTGPLQLAPQCSAPDPKSCPAPMPGLLIDGDRAGTYVLFAHDAHIERAGGPGACGVCHHENAPLERGTSCARCHADMYGTTDTFDHGQHQVALGGERSCIECHAAGAVKTRAASTPCHSCHRVDVALSPINGRHSDLPEGVAVGYRDAMHGLCIDCHERAEREGKVKAGTITLCRSCHTDPGRVALGAALAARTRQEPSRAAP